MGDLLQALRIHSGEWLGRLYFEPNGIWKSSPAITIVADVGSTIIIIHRGEHEEHPKGSGDTNMGVICHTKLGLRVSLAMPLGPDRIPWCLRWVCFDTLPHF